MNMRILIANINKGLTEYGSSHRRYSIQKVFLKISQIAQISPVLESVFNKVY